MSEHFTIYKFRAYTTREGYQEIDRILSLQQALYNAAIQERRDAWQWIKKGGDPAQAKINYYSQCRQLTQIRKENPELENLSRRISTGSLNRADRAFQSFFRRVKNGEKPGYPRFKSHSRFNTLETHGIEPSWLKVNPQERKATLIVRGIPALHIPLKNRILPPVSQFKTLKITRRGRRCTISLGFREMKAELPPNGRAIGLDMRAGIARVVTSEGRTWQTREKNNNKIKRRQRKLSRAQKGSNKRRKKAAQLANAHYEEQVSDYNAIHRFTSHIIRNYELIGIEDLEIRRLTQSAKGTVENPGTMTALIADRNRRILEQRWGEIRRQLTYKAGWAGRKLIAVDPRNTSRTCSRCGLTKSSPQTNPTFRCSNCELVGAAAHNAAINILRRSYGSGEGGIRAERPPLDAPQDILSIGALVPMRVEIPALKPGQGETCQN